MKKSTFTFGLLFLMVAALMGQDPQTITIQKQAGDIVIDGVGDEASWEGVEAYPVDNYVTEDPTDALDFEATFKLLWNDTALFFFVETQDADIYAYDGWGADAVEFYIQVGDGEISNKNLFGEQDNGYYQIPFRLNNKAATGGYQQDTVANIDSTVLTTLGYSIEGYMAWRQFTNEEGVVASPADGYTFALDVNVQDNDLGMNENSGATRNYWSSDSHLFDGEDAVDLAAKWESAGVATLSAKKVGIQNPLQLAEFGIYPNPVNTYFEINGVEKIDRVEITSVLGKRLMSVNLNNSNRIDISDLPTGMYFVGIFNDGNFFGAKKIMKK